MYKTIDEIPEDLRAMVEAGEKPRHGITFDRRYSHSEWHRAIDLISGKPGWGVSPNARVRVQCSDGEWQMGSYKDAKPNEADGEWEGVGDGCWFFGCSGRILGLDDWRDTLEHRPTDHTNELLDGDTPEMSTEPKTTTQALRIDHGDGFIQVDRMTNGGVMLTDQEGQEIQIKSKAVLEAIADAAYSLM